MSCGSAGVRALVAFRGRTDSGRVRRGFSLFEVLVAIGVILALSI
ncbi:MAG: prepilin-type N-terminal cleavage/methylation domain-containing protein, partial [Phycisphaerales bacterium]